MINSLIYGISAALDAEFGSSYRIYMEEIKQDLEEPCFFISCINPSKKLFVGKRYSRRNLFCIQYFPETENVRQECNAVMERLYNCLEYIFLPNGEKPVRGTQMNGEIIENVLSFFVNYDFFTYNTKLEEPMETMVIKNDTKNDSKGGGLDAE